MNLHSLSPGTALLAVLIIVAGVAIWRRPANLLPVLAASVYFEIFSVQGTTISRLLAPLTVVIVVVQVIRGRASIQPGGPIVWIAAYLTWGLASGLWTTDPAGTVHELSSLGIALAYMVAFASLVSSRRDLDRTLSAWAFTSMVTGLISFPRVSQALGFGTALQSGRSQGVTGDPNEFGAIQLVTLPLIVVLAAEARSRRTQIVLGTEALINASSIVTALSRGAFIGFASFLLVIFLAPFRFLFASRRSKAIALIVLALGITAVGVRHSSTLTSRVQSIWGAGSYGAQEGSGRVFIWEAAWSSALQRPWLGLGYGAYPKASNALLLRTPGVNFNIYAPHRGGEPVHNAYLESLVELGILGPMLYVGILLSTASTLRRTARRAIHANEFHVARIAYALIAGLGTWMITSIFLSSETSRPLWIIVGFSLSLPRLIPVQDNPDESRAARSSPPRPRRLPSEPAPLPG